MKLELRNIIVSPKSRYKDEYFVCDFHLTFDIMIPYSVSYKSALRIVERVADPSNIEYFWPYVILHIVSFISSLVLLITSLRVLQHIIYISGAITKPQTLDTTKKIIVLDFNHCRFIGKTTFKKRSLSASLLRQTLDNISSLNINFYFSCLHYILNIGLFTVAMKDMFSTGIISNTQLFLIGVNSFLDCADVSTIYSYDTKYNLLKIMFDKHTLNIFYFLIGSVIFFYIVTFIMFTFYQFNQNFSTITDCVSYVFALMLADSVKDVFHEMKDWFGTAFIFGIVFVFHMTFLQIFMGLMASSFQKTKAEFEKVEGIKAEQLKLLLQQSKASIKQFKSLYNTESNLKEEFIKTYVKKLKLARSRQPKTPEQAKDQETHNGIKQMDSYDQAQPTPNDENEEQAYRPEQLELHRLTSKSFEVSNIKKNLDQQVNDEINHFIYRRYRKKSEGVVQVNDLRGDTITDVDLFDDITQIDQAIKSLTFEIAILVKYNSDLLRTYFTEFSHLKNKQKFSFILVIASSELCDNLLVSLKKLNIKLRKIKF